MTDPAILVDRVEKAYGETPVLTDCSFSVEPGAVYGLLGPNGAGKTTTISILTGQDVADGGRVDVLGDDPGTDPLTVRSNVGILPEKESPPSFLTAREYFSFVRDVRGGDEDVWAERIDAWCDRLAFDKLDVLTRDLSRGQQQKVMLMKAFLHEPELVFIDEPLANLDPLMQERVKAFLKEYHAAGNTIVLSTHHIEVAEELCTTVGILHDGHIADRVDPSELAGESLRDRFIALFDAVEPAGEV
jgi:ABC-2 type transport system ATP-binding protein